MTHTNMAIVLTSEFEKTLVTIILCRLNTYHVIQKRVAYRLLFCLMTYHFNYACSDCNRVRLEKMSQNLNNSVHFGEYRVGSFLL